VVPFYESTVTEDEIPEDLRVVFNEVTEEEYKRFSYIKNYYKRYNKVMLDKIAIQQQKDLYLKENRTLKKLLKQYIDDISVNDDVMASENPLLVHN
jgi:dynein regulatory complex subunit 2